MNLDEFRTELAAYRKTVSDEAMSRKDSQIVLEKLQVIYKKFNEDERHMADHVFAEWVLSEDAGLRFDALALIDGLKIIAAEAALRALESRLTSSAEPGAPYEIKKVRRLLDKLRETGSS